MHTEVIHVDKIVEAVERILQELKDDAGGNIASGSGSLNIKNKVIYFDGWDGLGASVVLRHVAQCLTASASGEHKLGVEFSQIIHLDCSKWESRRKMQRAMAEQLELSAPVMEMLDAQDDEDDYHGVGQASRAAIPQVASAMYQHVQKLDRRFLVIFHNGSNEEIDLDSLGFPLFGYSRNKVLWTFQGRFRLYPRGKVDAALKSTRTTDLVLLAEVSAYGRIDLMHELLRKEASDVVREVNIGSGGISREAAVECFLFTMKLCSTGSRSTDYDLPTHLCNYWICDGVFKGNLQQGDNAAADNDDDDDDHDDQLWLSYDALHGEMRMDVDYYQNLTSLPSPVVRLIPQNIKETWSPTCERLSHWASPTYGFLLIPDYGRIPRGMFQQFDRLHVLKLSACKFSFKSPPFLCCHRIRFLWLDNCEEDKRSKDDDGGARKEDLDQFLQRLWVLDVRSSKSAYVFLYRQMMDIMTQLRELHLRRQSNLYMAEWFQGRPCKIRKFRVTDCGINGSTTMFSGMDKMELLDLSGVSSYYKHKLYVASSCSNLETVIIDGPKNLEEICLMGCARIKNIFLRGLFADLHSLDITGAAVKTLDLSAVTAPLLKKLLLVDNGNLCAILWPPAEEGRKIYLDKLHIYTTQQNNQKEGGTGTAATEAKSPTDHNWYICVRDARLLGSLVPDYLNGNDAQLHVEISISSPRLTAAGGSKSGGIIKSASVKAQPQVVSLQQQWLQFPKDNNAIYADVSATFRDASMQKQQLQHAYYYQGDCGVPGILSACPSPYDPSPPPEAQACYVHIQDMLRTRKEANSGASSASSIPEFVCSAAKVMHVHDSLSIRSIPPPPPADPENKPTGSGWNRLEWCRVERCPKMERVFNMQTMEMFKSMRAFWASHLPNARYIWDIGRLPVSAKHGFRMEGTTFGKLKLLHLYCCPRLTCIGPVAHQMQCLESLQVMWCGALRLVFGHSWGSLYLRRLKHIHLHELPMLQGFSPRNWSVTFPLETLKIRGCWSLEFLPYVDGSKLVECDCEKEWWDSIMLHWRNSEKAKHYKLTHPRWYKKTMLRGAMLR